MSTPQVQEQNHLRTETSGASDSVEKEIEALQAQLSSKNRILRLPIQWRLATQLANDSPDRDAFSKNLQKEFLRINALVSEANRISDEMQQPATFKTILQIPVSYLKINEHKSNNLCEPAVHMKERTSSVLQTWNKDNFELKLNDMREIYDRWLVAEDKTEFLIKALKRNDPFSDTQVARLIGVANIYLEALSCNSKLDYTVPIISTQGEVCGSLRVVLNQTEPPSTKRLTDFHINSMEQGRAKVETSMDLDDQSLSTSEHSLDDEGIDTSSAVSYGDNDQLTVKFSIKEARDLPPCADERVMCRYTFINPKLDQTIVSSNVSSPKKIVTFEHENEYNFPINDDFLSTFFQSSISVEVWYQSNVKKRTVDDHQFDRHTRKVRELGELWKDVKRHVKFSVAIEELNESGQWVPVNIHTHEKIVCGGIYRLKQGQSRRLLTELRVVPRSNSMPLLFHEIRSVEIGSISTRKIDAPHQLDSYQEVDLQELREQWLETIEKYKRHLDSQMNQLTEQKETAAHRENVLLEKLFSLAEERNIVECTPTSSGIPGSPTVWKHPATIEKHRPLIFLNIDPVHQRARYPVGGALAELSEEDQKTMIHLPLVHIASEEIRAVTLWDPTMHESTLLNQVTSNDTLIYLIVKVVVLISQPVNMEVVLRKRIAVTINKTDKWLSGKLVKDFLGQQTYHHTGVIYEIVSHIPEQLRRRAEENPNDSTNFSQEDLKELTHYASLIDSRLLLDRLRQEVLLAEQKIIPKKTPVLQNETSPPQTSSELTTELSISTPSMSSRLSFIEEHLQTSRKPNTFQIQHRIDLDEHGELEQDEEKYIADDSCAIGSQVLVNTPRTISNKVGVIRYIGPIGIGKGIWYGIELNEPVGKNNGSLDKKIYFECSENRGIFVRRDKIQPILN